MKARGPMTFPLDESTLHTAHHASLALFEKKLLANCEKIDEWFQNQWRLTPPPEARDLLLSLSFSKIRLGYIRTSMHLHHATKKAEKLLFLKRTHSASLSPAHTC